jgi:hypothetical protein
MGVYETISGVLSGLLQILAELGDVRHIQGDAAVLVPFPDLFDYVSGEARAPYQLATVYLAVKGLKAHHNRPLRPTLAGILADLFQGLEQGLESQRAQCFSGIGPAGDQQVAAVESTPHIHQVLGKLYGL